MAHKSRGNSSGNKKPDSGNRGGSSDSTRMNEAHGHDHDRSNSRGAVGGGGGAEDEQQRQQQKRSSSSNCSSDMNNGGSSTSSSSPENNGNNNNGKKSGSTNRRRRSSNSKIAATNRSATSEIAGRDESLKSNGQAGRGGEGALFGGNNNEQQLFASVGTTRTVPSMEQLASAAARIYRSSKEQNNYKPDAPFNGASGSGVGDGPLSSSLSQQQTQSTAMGLTTNHFNFQQSQQQATAGVGANTGNTTTSAALDHTAVAAAVAAAAAASNSAAVDNTAAALSSILPAAAAAAAAAASSSSSGGMDPKLQAFLTLLEACYTSGYNNNNMSLPSSSQPQLSQQQLQPPHNTTMMDPPVLPPPPPLEIDRAQQILEACSGNLDLATALYWDYHTGTTHSNHARSSSGITAGGIGNLKSAAAAASKTTEAAVGGKRKALEDDTRHHPSKKRDQQYGTSTNNDNSGDSRKKNKKYYGLEVAKYDDDDDDDDNESSTSKNMKDDASAIAAAAKGAAAAAVSNNETDVNVAAAAAAISAAARGGGGDETNEFFSSFGRGSGGIGKSSSKRQRGRSSPTNNNQNNRDSRRNSANNDGNDNHRHHQDQQHQEQQQRSHSNRRYHDNHRSNAEQQQQHRDVQQQRQRRQQQEEEEQIMEQNNAAALEAAEQVVQEVAAAAAAAHIHQNPDHNVIILDDCSTTGNDNHNHTNNDDDRNHETLLDERATAVAAASAGGGRSSSSPSCDRGKRKYHETIEAKGTKRSGGGRRGTASFSRSANNDSDSGSRRRLHHTLPRRKTLEYRNVSSGPSSTSRRHEDRGEFGDHDYLHSRSHSPHEDSDDDSGAVKMQDMKEKRRLLDHQRSKREGYEDILEMIMTKRFIATSAMTGEVNAAMDDDDHDDDDSSDDDDDNNDDGDEDDSDAGLEKNDDGTTETDGDKPHKKEDKKLKKKNKKTKDDDSNDTSWILWGIEKKNETEGKKQPKKMIPIHWKKAGFALTSSPGNSSPAGAEGCSNFSFGVVASPTSGSMTTIDDGSGDNGYFLDDDTSNSGNENRRRLGGGGNNARNSSSRPVKVTHLCGGITGLLSLVTALLQSNASVQGNKVSCHKLRRKDADDHSKLLFSDVLDLVTNSKSAQQREHESKKKNKKSNKLTDTTSSTNQNETLRDYNDRLVDALTSLLWIAASSHREYIKKKAKKRKSIVMSYDVEKGREDFNSNSDVVDATRPDKEDLSPAADTASDKKDDTIIQRGSFSSEGGGLKASAEPTTSAATVRDSKDSASPKKSNSDKKKSKIKTNKALTNPSLVQKRKQQQYKRFQTLCRVCRWQHDPIESNNNNNNQNSRRNGAEKICEGVLASWTNIHHLRSYVVSTLSSFTGPGGCALLLETIVALHGGPKRINRMVKRAGGRLPLIRCWHEQQEEERLKENHQAKAGEENNGEPKTGAASAASSPSTNLKVQMVKERHNKKVVIKKHYHFNDEECQDGCMALRRYALAHHRSGNQKSGTTTTRSTSRGDHGVGGSSTNSSELLLGTTNCMSIELLSLLLTGRIFTSFEGLSASTTASRAGTNGLNSAAANGKNELNIGLLSCFNNKFSIPTCTMDDSNSSDSKIRRGQHPQQQQQMTVQFLSNEELTRLQHPNSNTNITAGAATAAISSSVPVGALGKTDMLHNRSHHQHGPPPSSALECGVAHVKVTLQQSLTKRTAALKENAIENSFINGSTASICSSSSLNPPVYIIRHKEMFSALWSLNNNDQREEQRVATTQAPLSPTALNEQQDGRQNGLATAGAFDLAEWQPINEGNHIIHRVVRKIKQAESSTSCLNRGRGGNKGEVNEQSSPQVNELVFEKKEAASTTTAPGETLPTYVLIMSHPDDRLYYPEQYRRWRFAFECFSDSSTSSLTSGNKDSTATTSNTTETEEGDKKVGSTSTAKPGSGGGSLAKKDSSLLSMSDMIFGGGWKPYFRLNRAQQLLVKYTHAPETTLILWSLWPNSDISIVVDDPSSSVPAGA